ncbi:MAG: flippase-like domain-containing protein [Balneolales bacterium]|nr:flippase-like domain-containing protein [Balneolales bacterium]
MVFSISLSVLSMGLVIYFTWSPEGFEYVQLKRLPGLIIALVVTILRIWFQAAKYRILSDNMLSWPAAFRVILTWDFASAITPSTIGGGPVAAYAMTRENIPLGKSGGIMLSGVLLDQLFYVMIIPILITLGFYYDVIPPNVGWVGTSAMFLIYTILLVYAFVLAYGLLVNPKSLKRIVRIVFMIPFLRGMRRKIIVESDNLVEFSEALRRKPRGFLTKAFILSTLGWLAKISLPSIVVLSFLPADVLLTFLRSFSMTFAGLLVPTPGGSGGAEALFLLFQGPLFERVIFIGISIFMWRLYTYYLSIGLGVFVMTWYMKPRNKIVVQDESKTS